MELQSVVGLTQVSTTEVRVDIAGSYKLDYVAVFDETTGNTLTIAIAIGVIVQTPDSLYTTEAATTDLNQMSGQVFLDLDQNDLVTLQITGTLDSPGGAYVAASLTMIKVDS